MVYPVTYLDTVRELSSSAALVQTQSTESGVIYRSLTLVCSEKRWLCCNWLVHKRNICAIAAAKTQLRALSVVPLISEVVFPDKQTQAITVEKALNFNPEQGEIPCKQLFMLLWKLG